MPNHFGLWSRATFGKTLLTLGKVLFTLENKN